MAAVGVSIDHATVCGKDVHQLMSNLAAAGIPTVYGGAHINGVTEMALASFPDGSYLELIGIQSTATPERAKQHEWARMLEGDAGPCAWAVRAKDLDSEITRLKATGIGISARVHAGRQRTDGVHLEWETVDIGDAARGTFFPFLIHDFTPREQRVYPTGKPSTRDFEGVAKVVIGVRNLDHAIGLYRQAFGLPEPIKQVDTQFGAQLALLGDVPVILAQPLTSDTWLATRIEQFGDGPCAFILSANRPEHYHATGSSRWFGRDVSWLDPDTLGYRLGFERR